MTTTVDTPSGVNTDGSVIILPPEIMPIPTVPSASTVTETVGAPSRACPALSSNRISPRSPRRRSESATAPGSGRQSQCRQPQMSPSAPRGGSRRRHRSEEVDRDAATVTLVMERTLRGTKLDTTLEKKASTTRIGNVMVESTVATHWAPRRIQAGLALLGIPSSYGLPGK